MSGIRWDESQLAAYATRRAAPAKTPEEEKILRAHKATKRFQAIGRKPKGQMNKTERAYSERLEEQKAKGEIIDWKFHPMNVRLAKDTFYEVDFLVLHADMGLAIHETKGEFTTEKGQAKIKLCAEALPWFRFYKCIKLSKKNGGGWKIEEYSA